ncbi:MAG: DUF429 domain-containing protein [bacterium]|nr:DUF429 domain-containing protein [bacterium]
MKSKYIGIDGCPYGWCVAIYDQKFDIELHSDIQSVIEKYSDVELILIDIPIGLTSRSFERTLDKKVRGLLKPHKHFSVFTPPCREALNALDYDDAKTINKEITGKKISKQSYNISNKIKEADSVISSNKQLIPILKESHPELCFKYLNNGVPLQSSKKDKEGQIDRLNILRKHIPEISVVIESALRSTKRKDVKKDDMIDAACLMVCALLSDNKVDFIGEQIDDEGIPVTMAVPRT